MRPRRRCGHRGDGRRGAHADSEHHPHRRNGGEVRPLDGAAVKAAALPFVAAALLCSRSTLADRPHDDEDVPWGRDAVPLLRGGIAPASDSVVPWKEHPRYPLSTSALPTLAEAPKSPPAQPPTMLPAAATPIASPAPPPSPPPAPPPTHYYPLPPARDPVVVASDLLAYEHELEA